MQSSREQPLVGEEHCVTTLITAAKETIFTLSVLERSSFAFTKLASNVVSRLSLLLQPGEGKRRNPKIEVD